MSNQDKKDYRKFPPKQIIRDGIVIDFKKSNEDFSSNLYIQTEKGYQELYPSVYSIELAGEGYTKIYNFFPEIYLENLGLINYDQFNLYNYITTLRNRGYYLSITGSRKNSDQKGLAQMVGMRPETLRKNLDHLQDCLLIHRVLRLDLQGMPNELVVHTPFTDKQLKADNNRRLKLIVDRISQSHTEKQREKAIERGEGRGGGFGYLKRKETNERFQMDYGFIKRAFESHSRSFADFAIDYFKKELRTLKTDKSAFEKYFRLALRRKLDYWGILTNEQREICYIAANKFRSIYCPTDEEIFV